MNNGARSIVAVGCAIVALFIAVAVAVVLLGLIYLQTHRTQDIRTPIKTRTAPAMPVVEPVEIPSIEDIEPIIVTPETIEPENLDIEIIEPESEPEPTDISS
ncbi:MAG: hypothetical protein COA78_10455 [Blastopirellula sp.]|nr:MAG: hypothetical protein COA78_10455 [Blastopirellula sp.]